jgi:hypothetical protein
MNDPLPHDRQLLESATSRSTESLADGPQELRALWLAMGQRLDDESADFREEDLLARLRAEPSAPVALRRTSSEPSRDRVWPAIVASTLALSLLVLVMSWSASGRREGEPAFPETGDDTAAWTAWTDALDDDLDAVREQAGRVANHASGVDDGLANLADHMKSLSDDLSTSSL